MERAFEASIKEEKCFLKSSTHRAKLERSTVGGCMAESNIFPLGDSIRSPFERLQKPPTGTHTSDGNEGSADEGGKHRGSVDKVGIELLKFVIL